MNCPLRHSISYIELLSSKPLHTLGLCPCDFSVQAPQGATWVTKLTFITIVNIVVSITLKSNILKAKDLFNKNMTNLILKFAKIIDKCKQILESKENSKTLFTVEKQMDL